MRILLTGANGYVGRRLLPELLAQGHEIVCCVRDSKRLGLDKATLERISIWEVDFLAVPNLLNLPSKIDGTLLKIFPWVCDADLRNMLYFDIVYPMKIIKIENYQL